MVHSNTPIINVGSAPAAEVGDVHATPPTTTTTTTTTTITGVASASADAAKEGNKEQIIKTAASCYSPLDEPLVNDSPVLAACTKFEEEEEEEDVQPILLSSPIRETSDFLVNKDKAFTITLALDDNYDDEEDEKITAIAAGRISGISKNNFEKKKKKVFVMRCSTFKVEIICDKDFGGLIGSKYF